MKLFIITSLMPDIKSPSTQNDYQPCQLEKLSQILSKTKSLPTIIILDPVFLSSRENWRGMVKINGEKGDWEDSASPLCQMKENCLHCKPSTHLLSLGLAAKKPGSLNISPRLWVSIILHFCCSVFRACLVYSVWHLHLFNPQLILCLLECK